jgi:hypothetical protein
LRYTGEALKPRRRSGAPVNPAATFSRSRRASARTARASSARPVASSSRASAREARQPAGEGDLGPRGDGDRPVAECSGQAERGERGTARVVLVGERGAEEGHEAIAEELVDRALVAMHLGEGGLEEGVDEDVHPLRPEPLGERSGPNQIAEAHGDSLALAFQRVPGGEDPLGEVPRGAGGGSRGLWRRQRARGCRSGDDGAATLRAEPRRVGELRAAGAAGGGEPLAALETRTLPARGSRAGSAGTASGSPG